MSNRDDGMRAIIEKSVNDGFRKYNMDDEGDLIVHNPQEFRPARSWGENVSEFVVTNPASRVVGMGLQGVANVKLNPAGYVARRYGWDTKPLQAENMAERAMEKASEYAYDGTASAVMLQLLGKTGALGSGKSLASMGALNLAKYSPEIPAIAFGSGLANGAIEPKTILGSLAVDMLGGLGAGVLARGASGLERSAIDAFRAWNEARQIGKSYDLLKKNPLAGNADDIMTTIRPVDEPPINWRRGAAIIDENNNVVTKGAKLAAETGTNRNYGMDKSIYRHHLSRGDMQKLPRIVRDYQPAEITNRGQQIYRIKDGNQELPLTAAIRNDGGRDVSSMYRNNERGTLVPLSKPKGNPQSRWKVYQTLPVGYAAGDSSFVPTGGGYSKNLSLIENTVKNSFLQRGRVFDDQALENGK